MTENMIGVLFDITTILVFVLICAFLTALIIMVVCFCVECVKGTVMRCEKGECCCGRAEENFEERS